MSTESICGYSIGPHTFNSVDIARPAYPNRRELAPLSQEHNYFCEIFLTLPKITKSPDNRALLHCDGISTHRGRTGRITVTQDPITRNTADMNRPEMIRCHGNHQNYYPHPKCEFCEFPYIAERFSLKFIVQQILVHDPTPIKQQYHHNKEKSYDNIPIK